MKTKYTDLIACCIVLLMVMVIALGTLQIVYTRDMKEQLALTEERIEYAVDELKDKCTPCIPQIQIVNEDGDLLGIIFKEIEKNEAN